ncbi:glycosyltransferase [Acinetobacter schindleri]|uniref:glycosyltransferase n=1 Tax=Acinetobacter schindleri TaxID=108981 RepID=UPI003212F9E8
MNLIKSQYLDFFGKKVLFVFPSSIVGGHELMAIDIIKDLIELNIDVSVCFEPTNDRILEILEKIIIKDNIKKLPLKKRRLESLSAFFDPLYVSILENFLNQEKRNNYNSVILVQGDIEIGSPYLVAAKKQKIEIISYIPFTHKKSKMNKPLYFIRDKMDSILYKYSHTYITIYNEAAKDLKKFNPISNIYIIKNKVRDLSKFKILRNNKSDSEKLLFYIIGRIEFLQKGHDRLVSIVAELDLNTLNQFELHIIGDGPDLPKLKANLSKIHGLNCYFYGWMKEPWLQAYDADLLIIPSRFEGVPLVMLEALELEVPIIASKIDGMVDYLEENSLFSDTNDFKEKILLYLRNVKD